MKTTFKRDGLYKNKYQKKTKWKKKIQKDIQVNENVKQIKLKFYLQKKIRLW